MNKVILPFIFTGIFTLSACTFSRGTYTKYQDKLRNRYNYNDQEQAYSDYNYNDNSVERSYPVYYSPSGRGYSRDRLGGTIYVDEFGPGQSMDEYGRRVRTYESLGAWY